ADLGAHFACPRVILRPEQHEPRAGIADLGARHQHPDVLGCGVLAPKLEAVRDGLEADLLAALTAIDTLLHSVTDLVWHGRSPAWEWRCVADVPRAYLTRGD